MNYINTMNQSIKGLVINALKIFVFKPKRMVLILKIVLYQKKAIKKRLYYENNGIHIPPFLIASITNRCNLHCKGCYSHAFNLKPKGELTIDRWDSLFKEAQDLGISFILLAGGEPFIRGDIIKTASKYRKIVFPVFTNATLINNQNIKDLKKMTNIIPVISIEGHSLQTDDRRGTGISNMVTNCMKTLKTNNIFYGLSLTITKENFDTIINDVFIKEYIKKGSKLFFFVEYVPATKNTQHLLITQDQRIKLKSELIRLRKLYKSLFIAFPQDENKFGGCLSSGRGFMHISAMGDLEPCPFAPYSDTNLKDITLLEAIKSPFLKSIRESDEHLAETENGCALFNKKDWMQSLLNYNK